MKLIIDFLILGLAVVVGARIIPGVHVDGYTTALIAAIFISLANATVGAVLRLLTFPINFITLGLVSFLITMAMIKLVDYFMTGFSTSGFIATALFALLLACTKAVIGSIREN